MEDVPAPPERSQGGDRPRDRERDDQVEIADVREQFSRITEDTPSDEDAVRAFIENKIEMIRSDPNLSDAEKAAAIEEIRRKAGR